MFSTFYRKILLVIFICSKSLAVFSQPNIDSLTNLLKNSNDTTKVNLLINLGQEYSFINNEKALYYLTEALDLAHKLNYKSGVGKAHCLLGQLYSMHSDHLKALQHLQLAIDIWSKNNDQLNLAKSYSAIGGIYILTLNYEKALKYNLGALEIFEKIHNDQSTANCYSHIGYIYIIQKKYQLAIDYYTKSLKINLKRKYTKGITSDYINIATIYGMMGQYEKGLMYYDSIVPMCIENHDNYSLSNIYNNFGEFYIEIKQYTNAYKYLKKSLYYSSLVNNKIITCHSNGLLGKLYIIKNQIDSAIFILEKNLPLVKKINQLELNKEYYMQLSLAYEKAANYEKSLEYYKLYFLYMDSINQKSNSQKLFELQTRYDLDTKEHEIKLLNKDNELKNISLARQRILLFSIIISFLLTAALALVFINRFRIKRKANKELEIKNYEIEKQKQEIVAINEQLFQQAEELKKLDEVKSRLFTNISHEFRTPLTLIISPLENLLPKASDEILKTQYDIMLRQAKRLLNLVNQLLELSKLQKGMQNLRVTFDNFNRFLRTIISSYSSFTNELNIDLHFKEEIYNQFLWFDKDKIEKIITNLLTNAFKFTANGGKVEVTIRKSSSTDNSIEIVIADTGIGIEQENLKHIFNPFYQIDSTKHNRFEGTGIGLALVKELVLIHRGNITVSSVIGKGSIFSVQLPTEKSVYTPEELIKTEEEIESLYLINNFPFEPTNKALLAFKEKDITNKGNHIEKPIILVVEDNEDMRYHIRNNLNSEYHIEEAINGEQGINKANEIIPDLIISDIMMPQMNGLEMTKILKYDNRTSHIPVILLTAKASVENKIEGLETHADDYITKPFNTQELTLRIHNLITNHQKLREKFKKNITVNPSEITSTSVDEQFLNKALLTVEKNIDNSEYNAEKFCDDIGMSRSNLHRKLKALTDQSVTEFIRSIRLKRAAQLLKQNAGSVSEIAYQTGFNSLSYFTKCFKEEIGTLPSEYSEKYTNKNLLI